MLAVEDDVYWEHVCLDTVVHSARSPSKQNCCLQDAGLYAVSTLTDLLPANQSHLFLVLMTPSASFTAATTTGKTNKPSHPDLCLRKEKPSGSEGQTSWHKHQQVGLFPEERFLSHSTEATKQLETWRTHFCVIAKAGEEGWLFVTYQQKWGSPMVIQSFKKIEATGLRHGINQRRN